MSNINNVSSDTSAGGTGLAQDRRRTGRKSYQNPHLIGLLRVQDGLSEDIPEDVVAALPQGPHTRPFLALTVACCLFWGVVALLIAKL